MKIPEHLTITEADGTADCSACGTGITAPETFGGIPRATMLATFIVQHATHRGKVATGLNASGTATPAAQRVLFGTEATR